MNACDQSVKRQLGHVGYCEPTCTGGDAWRITLAACALFLRTFQACLNQSTCTCVCVLSATRLISTCTRMRLPAQIKTPGTQAAADVTGCRQLENFGQQTCTKVEHGARNAAPFFAACMHSKRGEYDQHDAHGTAIHHGAAGNVLGLCHVRVIAASASKGGKTAIFFLFPSTEM